MEDLQRRIKNSKTLRQIDEEAAEKTSKSVTEDLNSHNNKTFLNHNIEFILAPANDPNNMEEIPIINTATIQ